MIMNKIEIVYSVSVSYNTISMSDLIKKINSSLNATNLTIEELASFEEKLTEEYNNITEEYRCLFHKIKKETHNRRQEQIMNCVHKYIRYSEYHNESYFICDKCGHEKY